MLLAAPQGGRRAGGRLADPRQQATPKHRKGALKRAALLSSRLRPRERILCRGLCQRGDVGDGQASPSVSDERYAVGLQTGVCALPTLPEPEYEPS